jgi:hypothetical protein
VARSGLARPGANRQVMLSRAPAWRRTSPR